MSDVPSDVVRVRMRVVLSDALTLEIDREHGHFTAIIGRWVVATDGFGNLTVTEHPATIDRAPILKVRAAE